MTVEPFTIDVDEATLARLRRGVERFDFARVPDAGGWRCGVGIETMQQLVRHWLTRFDWRSAQTKLNRLPQFVADVDGQRIHFVYAKAKSERGHGGHRAVVLVHGWPGSFMEFAELVGPLTDPAAHGAPDAEPVDVIVPSLPGFAFSARPDQPIGPRRVAGLFHRLMTKTLGYESFVVQGGDWGAAIAGWMAHDLSASLAGIHLNMVLVQADDAKPDSEDERRWASKRQAIFAEERAYAHLQGTRPQTLAFAMSDSPVGVAAWIAEKFGAWSDLGKTTNGDPDLLGGYDADTLLTNIMLYLVTDAFATSTWIYRGRVLEGSFSFPAGAQIRVPTGVAAFPDPVFVPPPRSLAEKSYNIVHWSDLDKGGHFAALEQPDALLDDFRAFLDKL